VRSTVWRRALALAGVALILSTTAVYADQLQADADALVASVPHGNVLAATQQAGTTVAYDLSAQIHNTSPSTNDVFVNAGDYVEVTITRAGDWLGSPAGSPASFTFTAYDTPQAGTISVTVPCDAVDGTSKDMIAALAATASNGRTLNPNSVNLTYTITATTPAASTCTAVENVPPTVDAGGEYSGGEGSDIALDGGSAYDSDGTIASTVWSIVDQSGVDPGSCSLLNKTSLTSASIKCTDNGSVTVRLTATDNDGASSHDDARVDVYNVAPDITAFSCPADPVAVNTSVPLSGTFTDAGTADTHTGSFGWGDSSSPDDATINETAGTASGSHTYTAAGIYTPTLTVTDDDRGSDSASCQYVVVYDPSAGFVTGGGWILSPAGAYVADTTLTGKATFGFVSKYQKGASIPTGNTEFQFQAGGLNFKSSSYDWLVVQGQSKASYKGTGTINGSGSYGFLLSVIDNGSSGDTFRIKIWDKLNGDAVVYDNQLGAADDASASTVIGGGSIVIHTK
jgi:hypothetical protein